jgi:hypothetical protein
MGQRSVATCPLDASSSARLPVCMSASPKDQTAIAGETSLSVTSSAWAGGQFAVLARVPHRPVHVGSPRAVPQSSGHRRRLRSRRASVFDGPFPRLMARSSGGGSATMIASTSTIDSATGCLGKACPTRTREPDAPAGAQPLPSQRNALFCVC